MRPIISLILFLAACGSPSSQETDTDDIPNDTDDTVDTDDTGVVPPRDEDNDNDGFTEEEGDCDDGQPAINPMATDIVGDEIDQNCDGADGFDGDGDGHANYASGGDDCDDEDNFTFPGALEIWYDGKAQGCEVGPDEEWADGDQDGDGHEAEGVGGDDCLDTNPTVYFGAPETNGNGLDDNCNGITDGLAATIIWNPAATGTQIALTFSMADDTTASSLTLFSISDAMEVFGFCDGADCNDTDGVITDTGSLLEVRAQDTTMSDEFTTLTYIYRSDSVGGCVTWGPRAAEVTAALACTEADPTTW